MDARWQPAALPGKKLRAPEAGPRTRGGKDAPDPGLDPYVRWALHTAWRGFIKVANWQDRPDHQRCIQIIAKAHDGVQLEAALKSDWLEVSDVYRQNIPGGAKPALHFSASLRLSSIDSMLANPQRLRWKLALPLRDAESAARVSPKGLFGPDRDRATMEAKNLVADRFKEPASLSKPVALKRAIAVIDAGCPFLNEAFGTANDTRVAAIWDQGADPPTAWSKEKFDRLGAGWPWHAPRSFNYGRVLGREALNKISQAVRSSGSGLDETEVYRGIDFMIDHGDARRRVWFATHGGHVLSVAAGSPDPLPCAAHAEPDSAGEADLVFVQLPMAVAMDSGGGSLAPHLLDGVRYAMHLMEKKDSPLVVNISYGGQAGPHDGTSLIEGAFDELMQQRKSNFAIVLAAGNSRQARCHAKRELRANRSVMLRVAVPPDDTTDTFVEVWYVPPPGAAKVECRVRSPSQDWGPWVEQGQEVLLRETRVGREVVAMLRHDRRVPNGARSMILFALGPTALPPDVPGAVSEPGVWAIELRLTSTEPTKARKTTTPAGTVPLGPLVIDAWIERDDPAPSSRRPIAAFLDQEPDDELDTCSNIACGGFTVTVGGFSLGTGQTTAYSAQGTAHRATPVVLAACEEDEVTPTIAAAATRSSESYRLNGTSVAAPVLARRLFNHLVKQSVEGTAMRKCAQELASSGDPALKLPK